MPSSASPTASATGSVAPGEGEAAASIVRRIAEGDVHAETELVERYGRSLRFLLRRLTRDPDLADDLYQATFRVVLERLRSKSLQDPAGLVGFLRGTARNLLRNEERKTLRRRTDAGHESFEELCGPTSGASPLDRLLLDEKRALVRRLLSELRNQRDREILFRVYLAEDSMAEILRDLELDSDHFYRVLYRARQRLKRLLQDHLDGKE